ncbi:HAMP domain-containing sensor histidine kinase [Galbitalea sp. SE-J8]|uniref:sensor histidine kinase n=1 Tax=Galbitalea sp. SE-J8 TaxID=3054952 RepID=UPI00259CE2C3|nr:HAMP domain-containing sensor histidine kinase [Galbitalea sp. SE-J8]MDM4762147.1 HAMP domain-containing sensor histidine kinase [Galbitalea sp. SE-J8]
MFGLVLLSNAVYLVGLAIVGAVPELDSVVNVGLRLAPTWSPALVIATVAVSRREGRATMVLAALAAIAWAVGDSIYVGIMGPSGYAPSPAPSDLPYLAFYALLIAAIVVAFAPGSRRVVASLALNGAVASLGAASVLLVIVQPVLDEAAAAAPSVETALGIAYPALDVVLVAIIAGYASAPAVAGSRRACWLVAGIAVFVWSDVSYLLLGESDSYAAGSPIDAGWVVGLALMAWWAVRPGAATSAAHLARRRTAALGLVTPGLGVLAALGVLLWASQTRVILPAVVLAALTVALATVPIVFRQITLGRMLAVEQRALAELRRLDEARSELTATLTHELRTPLTSIVGFTEVVRDGGAGPITPETDEMLGSVEHSARRLTEIIEEMLVLSRLDSGALEIAPVPTDAAAVVARVVDDLRPAAEQRGVTLELAPASTPAPAAIADPVRLGHALTTVIENAVKYTPAGGRVTVVASGGVDPELVEVVVRDTGIGIPAADLPHVFERFYRASNAGSSRVAGSGLGLAIAHGIVEALGGSLTATSEVGVGTVMTVRLRRA